MAIDPSDPPHVHELKRGFRLLLNSDGFGTYVAGTEERICCGCCDLDVPKPDGVPDYSQVDRLWRKR